LRTYLKIGDSKACIKVEESLRNLLLIENEHREWERTLRCDTWPISCEESFTSKQGRQKPDFSQKENRVFGFWCKNPMVFGFSSTRNPNPSE
jgi:hypothetical protein